MPFPSSASSLVDGTPIREYVPNIAAASTVRAKGAASSTGSNGNKRSLSTLSLRLSASGE
jgi:hypothetical protein